MNEIDRGFNPDFEMHAKMEVTMVSSFCAKQLRDVASSDTL